jgi:hypothetical protein
MLDLGSNEIPSNSNVTLTLLDITNFLLSTLSFPYDALT